MESWGFSIYKIISSANRDNFISSFLILMDFLSFSGLIALARTSSTVLNRSGERVGNLVLLLMLEEKLSIFLL